MCRADDDAYVRSTQSVMTGGLGGLGMLASTLSRGGFCVLRSVGLSALSRSPLGGATGVRMVRWTPAAAMTCSAVLDEVM